MSSAELWQLGAAELARLTRAGDITATEAVTSAISRMDAVNPDLNAVVVDLREAALPAPPRSTPSPRLNAAPCMGCRSPSKSMWTKRARPPRTA